MEDDGNQQDGKQEDYSADSSSRSSSSSSSNNTNNNDTKIWKVTGSILCLLFASIISAYNTVCNNLNLLSVISDRTPDEQLVASAMHDPSTSTPSTTSAATAVQSDFAPFVGAVLTDRLIDEIGVLQSGLTESENKRLSVQITGRNGSPIYYEESLKNGERCNIDEIYLDFDTDGSSDGFPLRSLDKIEVRLGGVVIQRRFNVDDLTIQFVDDLYDGEENQMEYIRLQNNINRRHLYGPITCVRAYIKPLPLRWGQHDEMVLTDLLERVADENNDLTPQTLIINGLSFREKDITGIMSLIKK